MKYAIAIAAALLALSPVADIVNAATAVIGKRMVTTGDPLKLQIISRPERSTNDDGELGPPLKTFYLQYGGVVRVSWQFKASGTSTAIMTATVNGIPAPDCKDRQTSSATYVADACEIESPAGSLLETHLRSNLGDLVAIKNVRLNFNLVDVTAPATLTNDGD